MAHSYVKLRYGGLTFFMLHLHTIFWDCRTSHYPYAEEIMDFADKNGIMVINECPGVNLHNFNNTELLVNHENVMEELISR